MFCIYVFSDKDCFPIYVGKTKNLDVRIKQHLNRDRFRYNTWFYRWLNKQIKNDIPFYIDILEEVNQENWKEREMYWIDHCKSHGYLLTNMTNGGDGNNNQVFSKEAGLKRRDKLLGRPRPEDVRRRISKSNTGKVVSEETKRKLSELNKGKSCLESTKIKLSLLVIQCNKEGKIIQEFKSLTEASIYLKCRKSTLSNIILRKKSREYKNFIWSYKNHNK